MDADELKKMKVVDLRAELDSMGLESKGLKAELIQRLLDAQSSNQTKRPAEELAEDDSEQPQSKRTKVDDEPADESVPAVEASEPAADAETETSAADAETETSEQTETTVEAEEETTEESGERLVGKCKWFNDQKGYGFITDAEGKDLFVHRSNILNIPNYKGISVDEDVEYRIAEEKGKVKAVDVTGLGGVPVKGVFDSSQVDYKNPETFPQHTTEELPEGKQRGVCKWFDVTKGYGFITPADSTEDIFVHQSALLCAKDAVSRTLVTGENIEFELDTDDSGRKKAQNVTGPAGSNVLGQPQPRPSVLPYQQPLVGRHPGYAPSPYGGYGGGGFRQGYGGYRR